MSAGACPYIQIAIFPVRVPGSVTLARTHRFRNHIVEPIRRVRPFVTSGGATFARVELFDEGRARSNRQDAEERQGRESEQCSAGLHRRIACSCGALVLIFVVWRSSASLASFGDFTLPTRCYASVSKSNVLMDPQPVGVDLDGDGDLDMAGER